MAIRRALAALVLSGAALGCGNPDCEELCEDSLDCPRSQTEDCAAECDQLETLARASGCQTDYDDFITCLGDADDVCNGEECAAIGSDLLNCELSWCLDHGSHPGCQAPMDQCPVRSATSCHESGACTETSADGEVLVLPDCAVGQTCKEGSYSLTCDVFGGECICATEGMPNASVPYQAAFCEPDTLGPRIAAARAACGWP